MSAIAHLRAQDLVKGYRGRRVLDGVSVTASPGQRLGLVGENGVGKSTLLRLLAGVEEPDHGEVVRPADTGHLDQELPWPGDTTIRGVVDDALADVRAALRRLDELGGRLAEAPGPAALAEYGEVLEWAQAANVWDAERRARLVLDGLGLGALDERRRLDTLSGGQRSRLGLAALLIRRPRALLLDEPTNHLDDDAVRFLTGHLRRLPGVVVVARHDPVLLDEVCTDICDLDPARHGLTRYGGSYSDYLRAKRAQRRLWEQAWTARQEQLAQLRVAVATTARRVAHDRPIRDNNKVAYDRHGERVLSSVSSRVRNARQRLEGLLADQLPKPPAPLRFAGELTAPVASDVPTGPVLAARGVRVPGRLRLAELDVPAGGRLLVTGPNGAGKSTLLHVLAGRLRPAEGSVRTPP
ncbi:MAG TPA: ATP-binding cassette domain-containing protein, partial [Pseudonocardiaceae bacterium]|nr:ATP-binding cassette domain-containing protein [Pseudonocardiaceae bacterium]